MKGPDKSKHFPIEGNFNLQFVKNEFINSSYVHVGDFTYYDAIDGELFSNQILYHYPVFGDKLLIGKYCSIGPGTLFIMNGANHMTEGSTYPFNIFGNGWEKFTPAISELPSKGDTLIGNDVWIGKNVTILPGVMIGDGAIIGANSVVSGSVPDYSIVVGNPAKIVKMRFPKEIIEKFKELEWWHWPDEVVSKYAREIMKGNISFLEKIKNKNC